MKDGQILNFELVDFIPEALEEGKIYISMVFATAAHKCPCGCGGEVITPFSPTDWKLTFDGNSITLYPSIGNWNFGCQSHYWIRNNKVILAQKWSKERIDAGRRQDKINKQSYFERTSQIIRDDTESHSGNKIDKTKASFWSRLKKLF